ncbi:MAG TPA: hypothetical protein VMJ65_04935 [Solirubrobacteraceae bacterium]|nr:hypothetical protein [Solirubrobacteraceae bacterium]
MTRLCLVLLIGALVCAGCGGHAARPAPSPVARADDTHEYPSAPPAPQTATHVTSTATEAIRAFVTAYINWDAQTVSDDMRTLAARSVGQARAAMMLAAAQTTGDYELQRGGISNSGTVEAVAPLVGHDREYVVVTRESTRATNTTAYQGLQPAWHVALATVAEQRAGEWVVSDWQPEN